MSSQTAEILPLTKPCSKCRIERPQTEKVRGILCMKCNSGLGFFNDKFELLESALKYLKDRLM